MEEGGLRLEETGSQQRGSLDYYLHCTGNFGSNLTHGNEFGHEMIHSFLLA